MTSTEEMPQCAIRTTNISRCAEPVVGYFIIEAADVVPEVAKESGIDKPMPLCERHARMYKGRRVPSPQE